MRRLLPLGCSLILSVAACRNGDRALPRFPDVTVHYLHADFTRRLDIPMLDGMVLANALHFHRDKDRIVALLYSYLKPGGHFILVEYNVDQGNLWVPYPLSYPTWQVQSLNNGFAETRLLSSVPSRFLGEIYAALSRK